MYLNTILSTFLSTFPNYLKNIMQTLGIYVKDDIQQESIYIDPSMSILHCFSCILEEFFSIFYIFWQLSLIKKKLRLRKLVIK